jgi:hypothetical protein
MRRLLMLWAGSWLLLLTFAHGNLETPDTAMTMNAARALWLRGDAGLLRAEDGGEWLAEQLAAAWIARNSGVSYGKTGQDERHQYVWFPHGHVWLMVPAVAVGRALEAWFPAVEENYRSHVPASDLDRIYAEGQFVFEQGAVALLLPSMFGAASLVLLFLIAKALGNSERQAILVAATIALATQCFPLSRETLSDGPGLAFLLAALLTTVRIAQTTAGRWLAVLGGAAAGAAVLTRYQHAFMVLAMAAAIGIAAMRRRRWDLPAAFVLGGLPFALLLFGTNHLRFGSIMDTGYPPASTWFNYPVYLGLTKLLIAAGKGILWFSPILWLAVPLAVRRRMPVLGWLAWVTFAIPMLMFGSTSGWQSGQCWGARYVTAGVVTFLALALPQLRPWQTWPRVFRLLLVAGLLVNLTSLLAPTRGHNQLAGQATTAMYKAAFERGELSREELANVDAADHFFFLPRFSPLHAHWTYAWQSLVGAFEDEHGRLRRESAYTTEPLFGIATTEPTLAQAPLHWEDRGFRHLWFRFWGALLGVPWWLLALLPLASGIALLRHWWRRLPPGEAA